jgi:hypothetical protein
VVTKMGVKIDRSYKNGSSEILVSKIVDFVIAIMGLMDHRCNRID